jgi:hypothetical protein
MEKLKYKFYLKIIFLFQSKPKRKFVSHLAPPAGRDKMKRHEHVVKHGGKDHAAKQYGAEPDTRYAKQLF